MNFVGWARNTLNSDAHRALEENADGESETFGFRDNAFTREEEVMLAEYLLVFLVLLAAVLILQFYVGRVWKLHYLPESGANMLLGMFISLLIRASGKDTSTSSGVGMLGFSSTVFFLGFLPPIIYNSGYQLKRRLFFANLGGIMSLAVIGTSVSALIVGLGLWGFGQCGGVYTMTFMEAVCFGSLISATDPVSTLAVFTELRVDPTLFYLVFGESVMNDAVAITLFRTTSKFVGVPMGGADGVIAFIDFLISLVASTLIGYILGLFSAYVFKIVDMREHRVGLVAVFVCMVYFPFFLCGMIFY
jgi:sodium/hydrogen exchanger 8